MIKPSPKGILDLFAQSSTLSITRNTFYITLSNRNSYTEEYRASSTAVLTYLKWKIDTGQNKLPVIKKKKTEQNKTWTHQLQSTANSVSPNVAFAPPLRVPILNNGFTIHSAFQVGMKDYTTTFKFLSLSHYQSHKGQLLGYFIVSYLKLASLHSGLANSPIL